MAMSLSFDHPSLEEVMGKEWLFTNGLGGYASSSISGMNTRRYHGLLVASLDPPTSRKVLVSRMEETVCMGKATFQLGTNQYPGAVEPQGYHFISGFNRKPFPETTFRFEGTELRKTIFMPYGSNTTIVEYYNPSDVPLEVELRFHLVDRDHHALFAEQAHYDFYVEEQESFLKIYSHYGATPLYARATEGTYTPEGNWYHQVEYAKEQLRGQDFQEDTFQPGYFQCHIAPKSSVAVVFSLEEGMMYADLEELKLAEIARQQDLIPAHITDPFVKDLMVSADQFLVKRDSTHSDTIIAGYHWFTDWGRDSMIALSGLAISLGKQEQARAILKTFLDYLDGGMLPNRFPDQGEEPEYNTVDATLWLFVVLHRYKEAFGDWEFIEQVFSKLSQIIEAHIKGTRYDIHVNGKGFLFAGNPYTQLTWMDARVWGHTITPRWGCPVEINALWYNALKIYEEFSLHLGQTPHAEQELINRFEQYFRSYFLNFKGYLNDTLVPDEWADDAFRPNQLYALTLPYRLLDEKEEKRILEMITDKLLTPYGLRTLSPDHPDFKPTYEGNQWHRDNAYHQGTVWPFLLGEYVEAYMRVHGLNDQTRKKIETLMQALVAHFYNDACIHGISEIFDGGEPSLGKGTIHQAWSISALLDVIQRYQLFQNVLELEKSLTLNPKKG